MNNRFIGFLIVFFFPRILWGQLKTPDCGSLKSGTFYFYPLNSQKQFAIVRKGLMQEEINLKTSDTSFWKINWDGDCRFNLKLICKSQPMSDEEKSFFYSHTIFGKVLSVTKNYYVFKAGLDSLTNPRALTDTLWFKAKY
jgi:hypothetical protein